MITLKAAVKVMLAKEKEEYDSLRSENFVLPARVDDVTDEVRKLTANATNLRSANVDLMSRVAKIESLIIRKDERLTVATEKLR